MQATDDLFTHSCKRLPALPAPASASDAVCVFLSGYRKHRESKHRSLKRFSKVRLCPSQAGPVVRSFPSSANPVHLISQTALCCGFVRFSKRRAKCHTRIQNVNASRNANIASNEILGGEFSPWALRSGRAEAPHSTHQIGATLRVIRKPMPDLGSDQPTAGWKEILGRTVGIGLVLLAAFVGITMPIRGGQGSGK